MATQAPTPPATDPLYFVRPTLAHAMVQRLIEVPRRPIVLTASQRTGKTEFLRHELSDAAWSVDARPVWLPLARAPDPRALIESALAEVVRSVSAGAPSPKGITGALAELRRLEPHLRILLMLDDAHVLARPGSAAALAGLFEAFAAHPRAVWLMLSAPPGPQVQSLLASHANAGLQIALHEELPLLGQEFLQQVAAQLPAGETRVEGLAWAFEQLHFRPGELIAFARRWASEDADEEVERALARYQALASPDRAYAQRFMGCPPLPQRLMVEIATGQGELFALAKRRALAVALGREDAFSVNEISEALRLLEASHWIFRTGASGFLVEDEGYARWLRTLAGKAPVVTQTQPTGAR